MLIIPINSRLHNQLQDLAKEKRMIMMAGLLGTGKSLLIQQLTLIAHNLGRKVHLLQYDVARKAFETTELLEKYPERDGFTDPAIRKSVGLWARDAIADWQKQYPSEEHLLIGELPLIGNRLIEIAEKQDDALEAELSKETTTFVIPVPSWEVREVIEKNREASLAKPKHELGSTLARS